MHIIQILLTKKNDTTITILKNKQIIRVAFSLGLCSSLKWFFTENDSSHITSLDWIWVIAHSYLDYIKYKVDPVLVNHLVG